jgi:hypothetical protein
VTKISVFAVLAVLNEEDVEGLQALGACADEYDAEAQMIAAAVAQLGPNDLVPDRVLEIVADVCSRMFGPFDEEQLRRRQPVYSRVAERILSLIAG